MAIDRFKSKTLVDTLEQGTKRLSFLSKHMQASREEALSKHLSNPNNNVLDWLAMDQVSSYRLLSEWYSIRAEYNIYEAQAQRALKLESSQLNNFEYTHLLVKLFRAEAAHSSSKTRLNALHVLRQKTAIFAACQRLAFATSVQVLNRPFPFASCVRPPYNASINPGFWIKSSIDGTLPYYLWDKLTKRTVKTDTCGTNPEFVFISHTWGSDIDTSHNWVTIPGVPWNVPRIKTFRIEELPDKLARLQSRYVWIDLFTVPQGPENDELRTLQTEEISKQPGILRKAKSAMAWLSDMPGWSIMQGVTQFLGLKIFESTVNLTPGDATSIGNAKQDIIHNLERNPEIAISVKDGAVSEEYEIIATRWFRSPWTLQECCVRPDMLLADANFELLTTTTGYPIAINDVVAILFAVTAKSIPSMEDMESFPRSVKITLTLLERAGLHHLVGLDPLAIKPNGDKTYRLEPCEKIEDAADKFFDQALNSNKKKAMRDPPPTKTTSTGQEGVYN
ncbi:hypothetical protein GGR51DRAFT_517671 [Nemania sp. FL0031]|nr:hypothetical protein GGR51DRAFT_517671 [Nemania sp. FL0031]